MEGMQQGTNIGIVTSGHHGGAPSPALVGGGASGSDLEAQNTMKQKVCH